VVFMVDKVSLGQYVSKVLVTGVCYFMCNMRELAVLACMY